VDGKPCADNMENVDEKVNDTQVRRGAVLLHPSHNCCPS
jgi:hypothetical protein